MEKIIEVRNLKKSYGDVQAVRGIDFFVKKGQFFAFLGPNGAGKSTTIDILCTFLRQDSGEVVIGGIAGDDDAVRKRIGVVFQDSLLDALLTVRENLRTRAAFYGLSRSGLEGAIDRVGGLTGVTEFLDRRYGTLSGGQRRRADIARALLHNPEILILDEPTTGLDPKTRRGVWETVRDLQRLHGTTVFLTTHYMEEAATADYVAVIDRGLITAAGTPAQLRERHSTDHLVITPRDPGALETELAHRQVPWERRGAAVHIPLTSTRDALPLLDALEPHIAIFEVRCGSLDEAFINITGPDALETGEVEP